MTQALYAYMHNKKNLKKKKRKYERMKETSKISWTPLQDKMSA
jgi:hypothetical protein